MAVVLIREIGPDDWAALRDIRLAALRETPYAFSSAYAHEAPFTEEQWRARTQVSGHGVMYFAHLAPAGHNDAAGPAGMAGLFEQDGTADLVSMWVSPSARGHGVGEALVEAIAAEAKSRGYGTVHLWVTESNAPARRLYDRCGFTPTGEHQPLPSAPASTEIRMRRLL